MQLIRFTDPSENIFVLRNPEILQNIDKTSMKEYIVHFRHMSYGRILWIPARCA